MPRLIFVLAAMLFVSAEAPASAECLVPGPPPAMPRGAVASADDMKTAHNAIQAYVNALQNYQTCLEKEIAAAAPDQVDMKRAWIAQGDAAIDAAHDYADGYSAQLKIYKARAAK